ncbi:hypothetical protein ACIBF6_42940 [Streptosporangium amethystogenes]|uniref:hypothetical protein n=1 Tax=Streptosporangium amethystogenes TaxID=2002 RepID=UPI0037B6F7D5
MNTTGTSHVPDRSTKRHQAEQPHPAVRQHRESEGRYGRDEHQGGDARVPAGDDLSRARNATHPGCQEQHGQQDDVVHVGAGEDGDGRTDP